MNSLGVDRAQCRMFYAGGVLSVELIKDDELQKVYFRCKDKVSEQYKPPVNPPSCDSGKNECFG